MFLLGSSQGVHLNPLGWSWSRPCMNWSLIIAEPGNKCAEYNACGNFGVCNPRKKLAFAPFEKIIQHFAPLPKLIRKCPSFESRFSQNRVKPYSGVFKEPIVTF